MMTRLAIIAATVLLAANEAIPAGNGILDPAARLTATGFLGAALLLLVTRVLKAQQEMAKAISDLRVELARRNPGEPKR